MEFLGFDHVQLSAPAASEEEAREFFGKILGMREIPKPVNLQRRGGVWFQVGSQELHIGIEDPRNFHPNKKAHPAFEVRDVNDLRLRLISKGIQVRTDEALEGTDRFYAEDPYGNRLEFLQKRTSSIPS
jgi:catechol 2,3-dioxygenase-like lactoylglutathione lyase family enzyme